MFSPRKNEPATLPGEGSPPASFVDGDSVRRWQSQLRGQTGQLFQCRLLDTSINDDLEFYLPQLRARCLQEVAQNPMLEGTIQTWVTDLVGKYGPTLQVISDDTEWNDAVETIWHDWWQVPDARGRMSGAEMLQCMTRLYWTCGEWFVRMESATSGDIALRLRMIHPRQLGQLVPNNDLWNVALGIEFDDDGKVAAYYIVPETPSGRAKSAMAQRVEASKIVHDFIATEPDQIRGIPLLASSLGVIGDLRQYDEKVLDAATLAASMSGVLEANHEDIEPITIAANQNLTMKRNTLTVVPPGYTAKFLTAAQPTGQYVDFRKERQREIGRAVGMPLMHIRLDASAHNFSSARMDGLNYRNALKMHQGRIERVGLNRWCSEVIREGVLMGAIPPPPGRYELKWTWPAIPTGDPEKEARANALRLANGSTTLTDVCVEEGADFEQVAKGLQREKVVLSSFGLHPPSVLAPIFDGAPAPGTAPRAQLETAQNQEAPDADE
jgi:lambda family phage portal protein